MKESLISSVGRGGREKTDAFMAAYAHQQRNAHTVLHWQPQHTELLSKPILTHYPTECMVQALSILQLSGRRARQFMLPAVRPPTLFRDGWTTLERLTHPGRYLEGDLQRTPSSSTSPAEGRRRRRLRRCCSHCWCSAAEDWECGSRWNQKMTNWSARLQRKRQR